MTLPAFAASNAGNYDVVVSNAGGSVTSSVAVLSVGTLPGASIPAGSLTAVVGSDVTLNATTSGTSPFLYQWEFNGAVLPDIITTVAGNGGTGESGDGGPATNAMLYAGAVAMDGAGGFYIADSANDCVRRVDAGGIIRTVAGNGTLGFSGDGGAATNAQFQNPAAVAVDAWGNVYISDEDNNRVRQVGTNGIITTVAGNGIMDYWGDGTRQPTPTSPARWDWRWTARATFTSPTRATTSSGKSAPTASSPLSPARESTAFPATAGRPPRQPVRSGGRGGGRLGQSVYRRQRQQAHPQNVHNGVISTVAGIGYAGYYGDGGPATSAFMESPASVAVDALGNLYIADGTEHVRKVNVNGIISTVAGNAGLGYSGDGGPATNARLSEVYGLATDASGDLVRRRHGQQPRSGNLGIRPWPAAGQFQLGPVGHV